MPETIVDLRPDWLPVWALNFIIIAAAGLLALAVHRIAVAVVRRVLRRRDVFWRELIQRTRRPTALALLIVGLALGATVAPLDGAPLDAFRRVLLLAFIGLCGWIGVTALDIATLLYTRRFKIDVEDNLLARKHLTQTRILRRTASTLIVVLTIAFALMTFSGVRQYGVSLLASAGAAGIIAGLALQPFLTNLIAGVQIATTQPIRIDDAVIVEGEWGRIEEITSTYVVVRIWDLRRMILPLTYFIQQPFQNWTRETAQLIGSAIIYVDYSAPVDQLRAKLEEIARGSPLWDGEVVGLQVTDLTDRTMELRCLVGARNAGDAFDLRCEVREKMVAFLKAEYPHALPRGRLDLAAQEAQPA
ncbi:MAG: mechanosensitive ion channel family protein [Phenylobacterium sp.]|jgi:small-conductance mechanosensitive channel|uniref:mechanosensitive ion channel family protein n=1 Tax=Phenylobacterium sp. TaxID=1871053 RepID=UPI003918948E